MTMKRTAALGIGLLALVAAATPTHAAAPATRPVEAHRELATRTIAGLGLSNADDTARLTNATTRYLAALDRILVERAETIAALEATSRPADGEAVARAYVVARDKFLPLKRAYVAQLNEVLVPYQVERVKDGLTDDALPRFHAMYLEMVPGLTSAERAHVLGLLVEMRENAMTAIDAGAQEQWQDKYRGKINNYIARQGHDFRTLSKAWDAANAERSKRPPATRPAGS